MCRVRKKGSFGKGVFSEKSFSRDSREFLDSRVSREPPYSGRQSIIRPFSRDSRDFRDFRDSRDSSSGKTPFVMTPFSGPDCCVPDSCPREAGRRSCKLFEQARVNAVSFWGGGGGYCRILGVLLGLYHD